MLERRVFQEFRFGHGWLAARSVLAALEIAVQVEHHITEDVAEQDEAEEVVTEELEI